MELSDKEFEKYLAEAIDAVPKPYGERLQNVAFILEDEPSPDQRVKLNLFPGETLFGLYEGVPLPMRQGTTKLLPDKITIFKTPLLAASHSQAELRSNIGHTVWHEVAHYFGLDHDRIHQLDNKLNSSRSNGKANNS
ncbi:MAG TPA: metallopeptidase family protein [Candidatus Saccharimonadales bacterium]|nr:metallopeptidase family protein [Candidatus Saccharimonadales bacterium]